MITPIFQVDAFTTQRFAGNPAAVMPMNAFPADEVMQALAAENNLAETAFIVGDEGDYRLRWFTPTVEVPLCGHATLASAAVIMERLEPTRTSVVFHTASGALTVRRDGSRYVLDLPAHRLEPIAQPTGLAEAIGADVIEVVSFAGVYLALLSSAAEVRALTPDFAKVEALGCIGVAVTAPGDAGFDMVSRYFAPAIGIPEDPVTGGVHCALAPYWMRRLEKAELRAFQASKRGGEIICRLTGERVELEGSVVFYMEGKVEF
jgi:PhzF family phenazine biosynthesis protein